GRLGRARQLGPLLSERWAELVRPRHLAREHSLLEIEALLRLLEGRGALQRVFAALGERRLLERPVEDLEDRVVLPEADAEGHREADQADDDARPQLVEVLDETEAVVVADGPQCGGHSRYGRKVGLAARGLAVGDHLAVDGRGLLGAAQRGVGLTAGVDVVLVRIAVRALASHGV